MTVWLYDLSCSGTTAGIADRIAAAIDVGRESIQPASGVMPAPRGVGIFFGGMVTILGRTRAALASHRRPVVCSHGQHQLPLQFGRQCPR
ncbi:MAG: hypothetical protein AAFX39_09160, partial [Pseudomonadota bacterium]